MAQKLFLIDGSNHAFRVFHALPRFTAGGMNTGALLGFANMLQMLDREYRPDYAVVVFDKGASFRVQLFPEYKGHRPEMPPELREQWAHFPTLIEAWGYRSLAIEGVEADDVIGTLARRFAGPELDVVIVTGDKDFHQLVGGPISILDLMKQRTIDRDGVLERFGVVPEQVIDVLALSGDASDNVPGVEGIGPKTATQLIQKYGSLEALLDSAGAVTGKRGENLRAQADRARLSKVLVTIRTDVEVPLELADLREHARDVPKLRDLFVTWQLKNHLKDLDAGAPPQQPEARAEAMAEAVFRTVEDAAGMEAALAASRRAGRVAVQVEASGADPLSARIHGVALAWGEDEAIYVPLLPATEPGLRALLADPAVAKVGHDTKRTLTLLQHAGWAFEGLAGDTMLASYLLEPDRSHGRIEDLALWYLGRDVAPAGSQGELQFQEQPERRPESAHLAFRLDRALAPRLAEIGAEPVYRDIELPLVRVLGTMELTGIRIDVPALQALSAEMGERIARTEEEIYALAGRRFTINSPKQLQVVLFDERGLTPIKKTKTGYSTDHATLEKLARVDPLPERIVAYRAASKLKSTYLDTLPKAVSPVTGRVHTTFEQAVAATGRLSSNNPNLQNIPIRTPDGRRIRDCFVADAGHQLVSCDYSQIELRILAHYCGEGPLVEAFRDGQDVHRRTASDIFGVPLDEVTGEQRSAAKAINFGIVYGMSAFRLANDLEIPRQDAQAYLDSYFARYPQVAAVQAQLIADARARGYAETLWGRRRPIADMEARLPTARAAAERLALNSPIQGSAADLIKRAMIVTDRRLREEGLPARLLLQVHDELVLEVADAAVEHTIQVVREAMEGAAELAVPLKADAGHGIHWGAAH